MKKKKGELSDNQVLEVVSESTRKSLVRHKTKIAVRGCKDSNSRKYSKKKPKNVLYFNNGYDLLQYTIVVRPFIMKKYNMKKSLELEILLYLFPIQYFSLNDFKVLLTKNFNYNLSTLIELGYIELCIEKVTGSGSNMYTLTEHAVKIVKEYYQYLSGEKTLNEKSYLNPFKGSNASKADRAREKIMLKLKKQVESKPSLFREVLFR